MTDEPVTSEPRPGDVVDSNEERPATAATERLVAICFSVTIVSGLALAAVYWKGGQPQLEGLLLAFALGGLGAGMVVWAKRFLPGEEVAEERPPLASTEEDVAAFKADFERGEEAIQRRSLLLKLLGGAFASLGVAALFPIRSLGPRPGRGLLETAYRAGRRLVTEDGRPVRAADVPRGGLVTVWPDGHAGAPDSPTLLINTGVETIGLGGLVAYSKLCTHTGCPVGLYQSDLNLLLCPCHQSTFDVLEGAEPVFGPAARPLPHLPIGQDDNGFLVALGDFDDAVGAGFWDRPGRVG